MATGGECTGPLKAPTREDARVLLQFSYESMVEDSALSYPSEISRFMFQYEGFLHELELTSEKRRPYIGTKGICYTPDKGLFEYSMSSSTRLLSNSTSAELVEIFEPSNLSATERISKAVAFYERSLQDEASAYDLVSVGQVLLNRLRSKTEPALRAVAELVLFGFETDDDRYIKQDVGAMKFGLLEHMRGSSLGILPEEAYVRDDFGIVHRASDAYSPFSHPRVLRASDKFVGMCKHFVKYPSLAKKGNVERDGEGEAWVVDADLHEYVADADDGPSGTHAYGFTYALYASLYAWYKIDDYYESVFFRNDEASRMCRVFQEIDRMAVIMSNPALRAAQLHKTPLHKWWEAENIADFTIKQAQLKAELAQRSEYYSRNRPEVPRDEDLNWAWLNTSFRDKLFKHEKVRFELFKKENLLNNLEIVRDVGIKEERMWWQQRANWRKDPREGPKHAKREVAFVIGAMKHVYCTFVRRKRGDPETVRPLVQWLSPGGRRLWEEKGCKLWEAAKKAIDYVPQLAVDAESATVESDDDSLRTFKTDEERAEEDAEANLTRVLLVEARARAHQEQMLAGVHWSERGLYEYWTAVHFEGSFGPVSDEFLNNLINELDVKYAVAPREYIEDVAAELFQKTVEAKRRMIEKFPKTQAAESTEAPAAKERNLETQMPLDVAPADDEGGPPLSKAELLIRKAMEANKRMIEKYRNKQAAESTEAPVATKRRLERWPSEPVQVVDERVLHDDTKKAVARKKYRGVSL